MKLADERYLSGEYLHQNPSWDEEDSPWKAAKIINLFNRYNLTPQSICEVGCGAGGILAALRNHVDPNCCLVGYDLAPALRDFWKKHDEKEIKFILGDFLENKTKDFYDVLLLIDMIEHLENPFEFLRRVLDRASRFVLHIPLDIHASAAIRNAPFLLAYQKTGHLHYWNKDLAFCLLRDSGLEVIHWEYTAGTLELANPLLRRKLARWPRKFLFTLAPDFTVRLLGGYSLLVLAKSSAS